MNGFFFFDLEVACYQNKGVICKTSRRKSSENGPIGKSLKPKWSQANQCLATWSFSLIYWVLSFSTSRQSWYYRLCIKAYVQPISQLMHLDLTIFFPIKDGSPFVLYFIWESSHLCCLLGTNKAGYITLPSVGFS